MYSIYAFFRNVLVQRAEVQHHRATRILLSKISDISAVVSHGCIRVQACSRKPRHGSAKAVANDPALLRRVCPQVPQSSPYVLYSVCVIDLPRQSDSFL